VSGLQWLNTLLQAAWPAALEVLISNISAERLQEALDKVRASAVKVTDTAAVCLQADFDRLTAPHTAEHAAPPGQILGVCICA
jgi:hypothetical protein